MKTEIKDLNPKSIDINDLNDKYINIQTKDGFLSNIVKAMKTAEDKNKNRSNLDGKLDIYGTVNKNSVMDTINF